MLFLVRVHLALNPLNLLGDGHLPPMMGTERSCPGSSLCPLTPLAQNDCSGQSEALSLAPFGPRAWLLPIGLAPHLSNLAPVTRTQICI